MTRQVLKLAVLTLALGARGAWATDTAGADEYPGMKPFVLNESSLKASVDVNAPCSEAWSVITNLEKLRTLAPHLGLHTTNGQLTAERRGDVVAIDVDKGNGQRLKGEFVLTTPVPFFQITAALFPEKGPWMRIQQWTLNPGENDKKCVLDYNEGYNELWIKAVGIEGSGFIAKNRDHHMHVILRRIKNMAEGREPGTKAEIDYLFADAREFPAKFRKVAAN